MKRKIYLSILLFFILKGVNSQTIQTLDNCESVTGWSTEWTNNGISLDATNFKEGANSIQTANNTATNYVLASKTYTVPFNTGVDKATGYLSFWLYVSDVVALNPLDWTGAIEITSSGGADVNEWAWNINSSLNLHNGWNNVILKLSDANTSGGEANIAAINFFRIYKEVTGPVSLKIDDIKFSSTYSVLPVSLTSFSADYYGEKSRIQWTTITENNNSHFEIQKSNNGIDFIKLTDLPAKANSEEKHLYVAYDNSPSLGVNYYKLLQFDLNGKFQDFGVKAVNIAIRNNDGFTVYPNPSNGEFNLIIPSLADKNFNVTITDLSGKKILSDKIKYSTDNTNYNFRYSEKLNKGSYILTINSVGMSKTSIIIIN
ncbi:T9SS type A sorting domain-containing protein [Pedobacter cryophilus]|uniref:T9SS type A sorting domain-containing protein n=1 Tax=Pedobacter cryophilus TaxID=2571271 RepID=A0A4U1BVZ3_9SPHI|nr:T9SS type A sorting domain-containing protein [Pedobacter cryophilus]TKB96374.1 T9SS type A sorting domain-containing protein [Pedobacter cryophilus]